MSTLSIRRSRRLSRLAVTAALFLVTTLTAALPATAAGPAEVSGTCNISGCAAATTAYDGWQQRGWPTRRGWYSWSGGKCSFAGGEYYNDDGQLPDGDTFWEYDVYPRTCGAHRDAYRIVVDSDTGQAWYSPDHYADFYEIV